MATFTELKEREARRRLNLLGTTIEDRSSAGLRTRARSTGLPFAVLLQWHASYLHGGFEALIPAWEPVSEAILSLIEQRYTPLGACAEAETLSREDLEILAQSQSWTMRQATRWLSRYRVGGMIRNSLYFKSQRI